jgi:hypothetical protein
MQRGHNDLRDRALIALMVFSFARIGAALTMRVEDVYTQNRRLWYGCARKAVNSTQCHVIITVEEYLHAYLKQSWIETILKGLSC